MNPMYWTQYQFCYPPAALLPRHVPTWTWIWLHCGVIPFSSLFGCAFYEIGHGFDRQRSSWRIYVLGCQPSCTCCLNMYLCCGRNIRRCWGRRIWQERGFLCLSSLRLFFIFLSGLRLLFVHRRLEFLLSFVFSWILFHWTFLELYILRWRFRNLYVFMLYR